MNAVIVAVVVMLILSVLRINVVFSLVIGAVAGGITAGMSLDDTLMAFVEGLGGGAEVALSYGMLGGLAIAISKTGISELLVVTILKLVQRKGDSQKRGLIKALLFFVILLMSIFSQNLIPIHIAFIPLLIPPIIKILNMLEIDRRLIACILAFGLITPYMSLPFGFGLVYQGIVADNISAAGLEITKSDVYGPMLIPALGMVVGLVVAFFIFRKPRKYEDREVETEIKVTIKKRNVVFTIIALIAAVIVQIPSIVPLTSGSMFFGALVGVLILYITGALKWSEADQVLTDGMRLMAFIGLVMIASSGFASVVTATGDVEQLVEAANYILGDNKGLAVLMMLLIGLLIDMGIGSSFATIPIIAAIFVPIGLEFGLSTAAIITLIGTAGALGDAGSPASDSTLGPTAGLNVDGQHDHIRDTCIPTFFIFNIPLIIFGWAAVMFFS
ncbi:TRAP transporter large permease subunit [Ureibacillus sp. Re31]|uniref:TRAP transporter large permease subunit n=1 Tax=Ureibacillus galli TaxID=2762222 RepID=A0ABR8XDE0_9BACL|nr:Na+/H+ antiporter NhaC family protein [Ureibacillus galli]MBD8027256.1 TRAP transporter large permease subunit [Ureibacillus galli]